MYVPTDIYLQKKKNNDLSYAKKIVLVQKMFFFFFAFYKTNILCKESSGKIPNYIFQVLRFESLVFFIKQLSMYFYVILLPSEISHHRHFS